MKRRACALLVGAALALACGGADGWDAHGEVREVMADEQQVVIAHDEIEGLMPAMTMSFDVADAALLRGIEPGQRVAFHLVKRGRVYEITRIEPERAGSSGFAGSSGGGSAALAAARDPAPGFALTDHEGVGLALEDLRGKVVLLDFIFTRCPGPCPILTGILLDVQRALEAGQRDRVHFVSVSLDPDYDTPEVLKRYAHRRGIDTRGWSLLTGDSDAVEAVVRSYGVGSLRQPDSSIEHTVAIFLIDPRGRIAQRYLGLRHEPEAILADLERLL